MGDLLVIDEHIFEEIFLPLRSFFEIHPSLFSLYGGGRVDDLGDDLIVLPDGNHAY